jgi:hypothetical protein
MGSVQSSSSEEANNDNNGPPTATNRARPIPRNFTLLHGCSTMEEHDDKIAADVATIKNNGGYHDDVGVTNNKDKGMACSLRGTEGLKALGFEFRFVPCHLHSSNCNVCHDEQQLQQPQPQQQTSSSPSTPIISPKASCASFLSLSLSEVSYESSGTGGYGGNNSDIQCCHDCATRLFYVGYCDDDNNADGDGDNDNSDADESSCEAQKEGNASPLMVESQHTQQEDVVVSPSSSSAPPTTAAAPLTPTSSTTTTTTLPTMITTINRKQYISDGIHYDLIANLAQEAAQSIMCDEFNLEWVTVCNNDDIRAMVDKDHPLLLEENGNRVALREMLFGGVGVGKEKKTAAAAIVGEEKKDDGIISTATTDDDATTDVDTAATMSSITKSNSKNNSANNTTKSTLLIATGRGKVRAGIFSRHHLLTSGIQIGTAWHFIREARTHHRNWGVAIIDPNARGEEVGYETFQRSVSRLFSCDDLGALVETSDECMSDHQQQQQQQQQGVMSRQQSVNSFVSTGSSSINNRTTTTPTSIYILAHSAAGGQLVRHLREDPTLLPSIKAIAFTDSTHNVQWCKSNPTLKEFLQKENCVYIRSNDVRSSQSCVRVSSRGKDIQAGPTSTGAAATSATICRNKSCSCITQASGQTVDTDQFWQHRFGDIRTVWAGTPDHSLSNYSGLDCIMDHFDKHANVVGEQEGVKEEEDGLFVG